MMVHCVLRIPATAAMSRSATTTEYPKMSEETTKMPSAWKRIYDGGYCKWAFRRF